MMANFSIITLEAVGLDGAMVLWIGFAILAAAVVWALTRPLRMAPHGGSAPDSELAVYKDQLAEIETERAQGLIGGSEAEAARVEVARRLIRRAEERERADGTPSPDDSSVRSAVMWTAAALPLAAISLYLFVGSPELPGRPYAARLDEPLEKASASDLVAKVEAHLRTHPNDGRGWDVLAPVYLRSGDFRQAADAFQRATKLLGESPKRLAGFARAKILLDNGVVGEPARKAYERLHELDPKAVEPRVWLAIAKEQDGDLAGAEAEYKELLAAKPGEPWKSLLDGRIRAVTMKLVETPAVGVPPPDGGKPDFHNMTPEQRQAFVEKMVDGLATRLKTDGKDLAGWMQLVRSYVVLGRTQDANTALAEARKNFAGDEKALAQLQALAQVLGIGS
jgi:cytochrome c-type biogenesis protein CcmH